MSDVPESPYSYRVLWPNLLGLFAIGYMTSFWIHFLFRNDLVDFVTGLVAMAVVGMVAFVIGDRDARRERKKAAQAKAKQREPDPLEIPDNHKAGAKLDTLHRIAGREDRPS